MTKSIPFFTNRMIQIHSVEKHVDDITFATSVTVNMTLSYDRIQDNFVYTKADGYTMLGEELTHAIIDFIRTH